MPLPNKPSEPAPETSASRFRERRHRSLAKAVSWRVLGTLDTVAISWLITGKPVVAISIRAVEVVTKCLLYYGHERVWGRIEWGKS